MATIKSHTDLEQSKVLAEFLSLESADMFYADLLIDNKHNYFVHPLETYGFKKFEDTNKRKSQILNFIPCWSLAALLQVLPLVIYDDDYDYELNIDMIDKMPRYIRLGDIYHSQFPYDFEKDTLLDNIVESIIWLNKLNANLDYYEMIS